MDQVNVRMMRFFWRWFSAGTLSILFLFCASFPARAAEITIPLTIRFDVLTQALARQVYTGPGGQAQVWQEGACRYLYFDQPQLNHTEGRLRFTSHGTARIGTEISEQCLSPIQWQGFVEVLLAPYLTADWQLRFRILDSNLYDEKGRKGLLTGPIWDIAERFFLPHLTGFAFDLTPPREEVLSLVRVSVPTSDTAQIETVLRSVAPKGVDVTDAGVVVQLALTVPDAFTQTPPPAAQPEAPLTPAELEEYQRDLEHWDAFLVFVVKGLGLDMGDQQIREELLDLLLTSRYALLPILAGEITRSEGDPVRRLFIETWNRLHEIMQKAEQRGLVGDKILRYAAFIDAGDALLAIDQAVPGLGIEISADGLRRLARILQPDIVEDPLAHSLEVDPTLRTLFGFSPELHLPTLPLAPPSRLAWVSLVYAAAAEDETLAALRERLDRWVPEESELADYRPVVEQLLQLSTDQTLQGASLETRHTTIYRTLVPATALQESCWRQFTRKRKKVTTLVSPSGSIGLMQINRHVWRGFYNVHQLQWDAVYNTQAGAEILMHYLQRYGIQEGGRVGKIENIARATYVVYNAGPKAVARYRTKNSSPREKRVDTRFWRLYQGFAAEGEVDLSSCTVK